MLPAASRARPIAGHPPAQAHRGAHRGAGARRRPHAAQHLRGTAGGAGHDRARAHVHHRHPSPSIEEPQHAVSGTSGHRSRRVDDERRRRHLRHHGGRMSGERAHLALADGKLFEGIAWGAGGTTTGEVVFTTGMTGYEEVLTDPSYCGQIVTMTAPQIGNTGINPEDSESVSGLPQVAGFVVRDASLNASNYRASETLDSYLTRHGVVAITGVDTRALTRHLRDHGSQNGAIGTSDPEILVKRAREAPSMEGQDLVERVTPKEPYLFTESSGMWGAKGARAPERHVVAVDLGLKRNILRCLVDAGCRLT